MVELDYLSKLLDILALKGVGSFKYGDLEVTLKLIEATKVETPVASPQEIQNIPISNEELPPDLRTDSITSYDKMLHWSSSPDPADEDIPLTGDQPFQAETLAAP